MNIDGLGPETVEDFFDHGLIHNVADLYELTEEKIIGVERIAEKSAAKIIASINKSKEVGFEKVLFALGIKFVGETTAKRITEVLPDIDSIMSASFEQLTAINDVGERIAGSIIKFFNGTPINFLATDTKFWAMLGSFIFGAVGYYMLIFISGIEKIPADLYEAATIDGASKVQQAFKITFPLLKGVTKTNLTFWTINTATFYLWSKMFSPVDTEASVVVPVMYLYDTAFPSRGSSAADPGAAAAVGIVLAVIILVVYLVMNKLVKDDDIEL